MLERMLKSIVTVSQKNPLVLNITNDVTMDFIANGLLAIGASPLMIKAREEIEDIVKLADCIVINIGTLDGEFIKLSAHVALIANQFGKPLVLDPVGAGASRLRTATCLHLLRHYRFDMIRGNASELMALSGANQVTKGVDSTAESQDAVSGAQSLSKDFNTTQIISGATDIIIDHNHVARYSFGSPLMPRVIGSGCLLSSVIAAFHAVEKNRIEAATHATLFYALCGEIAAQKSKGPGTFKANFLDALSQPNEVYLRERLNEYELERV